MELNNKIAAFLICILLAPLCQTNAQAVKYWVQFKDKNGTPFNLSSPGSFLTEKSITRRHAYGINLDNSDLPVVPSYVSSIGGVKDVRVLYASKWLNGVVISIPSSTAAIDALNSIGSFAFVTNTVKVRRMKLNNSPEMDPFAQISKHASSGEVNGFRYGGSNGQNKQLHVECLHNQGCRGQGITIAVCDVGFDNVDSSPTFDSLRNNGGIMGTRDFVSGGISAYHGGSHGTMVLSCMAGNKPGIVLGTAPMANYWLLRTEDGGSETISEEYNWVRGAEFADSVGVDIITTSLGYTEFNDPGQNHNYATLNGRTAPMSIAATMAARKGILVFNAAGNEGEGSWHFVSVPGDADSICTVGAVDTLGKFATFSSVGPTADGRIKPDLAACGLGAWVCDAGNSCFPGNGTSFSTPILAGAAACYWQAQKRKNNISILNDLKQSASSKNNPNNQIGWGIPNVCIPVNNLAYTIYQDNTSPKIIIDMNSVNDTFIKVEIIDLVGRILFSENAVNENYIFELNASVLADGIYLVKITTSAGTVAKKFLK